MSENNKKGLSRVDNQGDITPENISMITGQTHSMGRDPKAEELLSGLSRPKSSEVIERKAETTNRETAPKQKQKTKAQQTRIRKDYERRKKESILFYLPEEDKNSLIETAKELEIPYSQICTFAVLKYLDNIEEAKNELKKFRISSNVPVSKYMLDLKKTKKR
jgi:outer membrane phospholipase A